MIDVQKTQEHNQDNMSSLLSLTLPIRQRDMCFPKGLPCQKQQRRMVATHICSKRVHRQCSSGLLLATAAKRLPQRTPDRQEYPG